LRCLCDLSRELFFKFDVTGSKIGEKQTVRSWGHVASDHRSDRSVSTDMFPDLPVTARQIFLADFDWLIFQRRRHRVIPSVEKPEYGNHTPNFDDLLFGPLLAHFSEYGVTAFGTDDAATAKSSATRSAAS
jgi:hypothetical protein